MYDLKYSSRFKKDLKLCAKRGYNLKKMEVVLDILASGKPIPEEYHDHPLAGSHKGPRDLYIEPDWVLIYKIEDNTVILLITTGTHSDLFKK
ncbi:MAG: type II toxin-antitoxin system YafQ family toxin [Alphaproteobacteria bacterium]|nr:type II toxin-antitoxin system YafQ family toxin [Alphaproteobacteria bacterium]